jgi:hypothetical protein
MVDVGRHAPIFGAGTHLVHQFVEPCKVFVGDDFRHLAYESLFQGPPRLQQLAQRNAVGLKSVRQLLDERAEAERPDKQTLAPLDLHHAVRLQSTQRLTHGCLADIEQGRQLGFRGQRITRSQSTLHDEGADGLAGLVREQRPHVSSCPAFRISVRLAAR